MWLHRVVRGQRISMAEVRKYTISFQNTVLKGVPCKLSWTRELHIPKRVPYTKKARMHHRELWTYKTADVYPTAARMRKYSP
jgi:hypothetical protein